MDTEGLIIVTLLALAAIGLAVFRGEETVLRDEARPKMEQAAAQLWASTRRVWALEQMAQQKQMRFPFEAAAHRRDALPYKRAVADTERQLAEAGVDPIYIQGFKDEALRPLIEAGFNTRRRLANWAEEKPRLMAILTGRADGPADQLAWLDGDEEDED